MTSYQKAVARYGLVCPWMPDDLIPDLEWWFFRYRCREMPPAKCEAVWWEARSLRQKQRQAEQKVA